MKKHFSIAIDGPGGAGKSTLAKAVAKKLNILHVDTGAIYRTIGYAAFSRGLDAKDESQIAPLLKEIQIDMAFDETGGQKMLLDGKDVSTEIRLPEIGEEALGALIYFFEFACGVSGYMEGVNPFNQPGVEAYKKNMFALLGKPGYEEAGEALRAKLSK